MIQLPNIKPLSAKPTQTELKQAIDSVRVWVEALRKAGNVPTVNDFVGAGIVSARNNTLTAVSATDNLAVPPAPDGVSATGVVGGIVVSWGAPGYEGHAITEVWRSTEDTLGSAVLIGSSSVSVYTDIVPDGSPGTTYYYWVRFRNVAGVEGPYHGTTPVSANMLIDPNVIAEQLAGKISNLQLATDLQTKISLLDISSPLQGQLDALVGADSSLQTTVDDYTTQFTTSFEDGAADLLQAILDTDSAFQDIATQSTQIASLEAELSGAIALFSTDATAQIDALNALTAQISTLQTSVDNNASAITAEEIARSNADSAQANTLSALQTEVDDNAAAIVTEQQARSDGDSAEASARNALAAQILGDEGDASASGLIYDESQLRLSGDTAIAGDVDALTVRVTDVEESINTGTASVSSEASIRAERDLALAKRTDRVVSETSSAEGVLENVLAAADNAENVRTSKATYDLSIATLTTDLSAEVIARESLAARVDDTESSIVTEQTARADADSALANSVTQLSTTVGGNTATIEEQATTINGLGAQWTVKVDNNGNVAGIGLSSEANDETGVSSAFGVNADTFFMTKPGALDVQPFVLTELDPVGNPGVYTLSLAADVQIDGNLSVQQLTTGKLPTDAVVQIGEGITLNGNGTIIVAENGGITGNDYVLLTNGQLQYMVFNGTDHVPSKALRMLEMGTAATGQTVSIPGYWKNQPKVMCMLKSLESYAADTSGQSQSWEIDPGPIQLVAAGSYQFTPTAQLVLSAGGGSESINDYLSNTSDGSYLYFPVQHTQANCTKITASIKALSIEATAEGDYQRKLCNWRIRYSRYSDLSSSYYSTWKTLDLGATTGWVSDSMAVSPSSDDWYFRVEAYFEDYTGQTFAGPGTTIYEQQIVDTISGTAEIPYQHFDTASISDSMAMGAMPIPSGYTADDLLSISIEYQIGVYANPFTDDIIRVDYPGGGVSVHDYDDEQVLGELNVSGGNFISYATMTYAPATWPSSLSILANPYGLDSTGWVAVEILNPVVTLQFRREESPSTTPNNNVEFDSYTYELSSKTVLADGTVTWVAIGD